MNKPNKKRYQLNIRLTQEQNELIKQKLNQTQISKTQLILDSLTQTPIYQIPHLPQTLTQIKTLINKVNELSLKIDEHDKETKITLQEIQKGCDELWQYLKLLKQEKQNKA